MFGKNTLLYAACAAALATTACKKEDDHGHDHNEGEVITTITVSLTDSGSTTPRTFVWSDPDGPGGNAPTIDTLRLTANTRANASLKLEDRSVTPAKNITVEIEREENEHQFFFTPTLPGLAIAYDPTDFDTNTPPKPLGLRSFWRTAGPGRGTVRIVLKHQPGIKASIPNTVGDATRGETDIEVVFPVIVQ